MERRTLLAIFLIMAVLIGDQIYMSYLARKRAAKMHATQVGAGVDSSRAGGTGGTPPAGQQQGSSGSTGVGVGAGGASTGGTSAGTGGASAGDTAGRAAGAGGSTTSVLISTHPRVAGAEITTRELRNDQCTATVSSRGGTIEAWVLPKYKDLTQPSAPVNLVAPGQRALLLTVSTPYFTYDFTDVPFRVEGIATGAEVTFVAEDSSGVRVSKRYRMVPGTTAMDVEVHVSAPPALGPLRYQIGWAASLPNTERNVNMLQVQAVALLGDKLEHYDAKRLGKDGPKTFQGNVRWAGNRTKYFVAALIPDSATVGDIQFAATSDGHPTVWLAGGAPAGTEIRRHARLYAGPVHYETLVTQGARLDLLANLGWAWIVPLSALLLRLLNILHGFIANYGVGIIILSAATKLVFHPLTLSSMRSMKVMHHLQPEVKELQERYKSDPQKMNQHLMDLYKRHKVNPLSGCLPMLLQMPVFFALYNVLLNSIELRGAGFMAWMHDLSVPDQLFAIAGFPLHLMPLLMTGSTYLMQSQTPVAPQQKPMMMLMPVMMLVFMYNFPSGVVLYWTVNNVLSALQQYWVNLAEDRKMAAGS